MNKRQLESLGVPAAFCAEAVTAIAAAGKAKRFGDSKPADVVRAVLANPEAHVADPEFGAFAKALLEGGVEAEPVAREPAPCRIWGDLDPQSIQQMEQARRLPVSARAALMPDAHVGYGLPIGGVLATENAVIPYAVGVDIACRMRLSISDLAPEMIDRPAELERALLQGTKFGVGASFKKRQDHDVMDQDWGVTRLTGGLKDLAWTQLGSSGSGNHFVEWGVVTLPGAELGLEPGRYLALLSHSGSRGAGSKVCQHYSTIAMNKLPKRYQEFGRLAWLDLDDEAGAEYWAAMNLMGDYAAANHAVIHRNVLSLAGGEALATVENHHNFAWKETHDGKEYVVHRKGATPAGEGVLGVIPGNMIDPAFVVRGKGNEASLNSASHGAGRAMSRTAAREKFTWKQWKPILAQRGVRLLGGGLDEVPGVYKNIREVMAAQRDLVTTVATFEPKVVLMCADGSRPED